MAERPRGSNNTEPGKWFGLNGNAWCAMFQSWSFYSVVGHSPFPATTSKGFAACVSGANWFRHQGAWAPASATPQRGWLIFFIWSPGDIEHHIGLVLDSNGPRNCNTVEGNVSDQVGLHHRGGSTIAGYGIINYVNDLPAPGPKPAPVPTFKAVRMGSTGPVVGRVQDLLRWYSIRYHAPDVNPGPTDKQFGRQTGKAVLAFKKRQHDLQVAFKLPISFNKPFDPGVGIITYNALLFWSTA